jgi:alpha,alpha-trehalose phosphorylase
VLGQAESVLARSNGHSTLPLARKRARQLGLEGAAFRWRTIDGHECSAYWPAGVAAFHVGADIAYAVVRYVRATGDVGFEAEVSLEILVETVRLWRSLGHHHLDGTFRIDGVTAHLRLLRAPPDAPVPRCLPRAAAPGREPGRR